MLVNSSGGLGMVVLGGTSGFIFSKVCEDNLKKQSQFSNNKCFLNYVIIINVHSVIIK